MVRGLAGRVPSTKEETTMATKVQSKTGVVTRAQSLIAGVNKHLSTVTSVTIAGQSLTPAQIVQSLQTLVDLRTAVLAAQASAKAKVSAETSQLPPLRALMSAFTAYVKASYLASPEVLADFGLQTKARAPLTTEAQTAANAKRAATRAARHTMGSQQRKAVKGDVTGVTVTPIVATHPTPAVAPTGPSSPTSSVQDGAAKAASTTAHAE
jgi:hypothetical protein